MMICDLCKRDPVRDEANPALKQAPWGLVMAPPPGSGLPTRSLCWACWDRVFQALIDLALQLKPEVRPN